MKTGIFWTSVITASALIASCNEMIVTDKTYITLTADMERMTRISLTEDNETVVALWESDDKLTVWPRTDGHDGSEYQNVDDVSELGIISGAGSRSAAFSGMIYTENDSLNVIYCKNILTGNIKERTADGAFLCDATEQLLTTELNEAPLVLAGAYVRNTDRDMYEAIGGKMIHGGALFRITIEGLSPDKEISKITVEGEGIGMNPGFYVHEKGSLIQGEPYSADGNIVLDSNGRSVKTDNKGSITIYAYIIPSNSDKMISDRVLNVVYGDGTGVVAGVLKFKDRYIEYGKCYSLNLKTAGVTAGFSDFIHAGEITLQFD